LQKKTIFWRNLQKNMPSLQSGGGFAEEERLIYEAEVITM